MPIRPEMKALYPADWKRIRAEILARAGNKCEKCGRPNGEVVVVGKNGDWRSLEYYQGWADSNGRPIPCPSGYYNNHEESSPGYHGAKTILTVSHQDHDPRNNDPSNLKALCQRCHLVHDAKAALARAADRLRSAMASPSAEVVTISKDRKQIG